MRFIYYKYNIKQKTLTLRTFHPDTIGYILGTEEEFIRVIKAYDLLWPEDLHYSSINQIPSSIWNNSLICTVDHITGNRKIKED